MNPLACRFSPHSHLAPTDTVCELTKFSCVTSVVRVTYLNIQLMMALGAFWCFLSSVTMILFVLLLTSERDFCL